MFLGKQTERPVTIDVHPQPADGKLASLGPGALAIELTVTARNVNAVRSTGVLRSAGDATDVREIWNQLRLDDFRKVG